MRLNLASVLAIGLLCACHVRDEAPAVQPKGEPGWASLGVKVETLPGIEGASVTEVFPDSSGQRAGLQTGDVIHRIDDLPIRCANDLVEAIATKEPYVFMRLAFRRGSDVEREAVTQLDNIPPERGNGDKLHFPPPWRGVYVKNGGRLRYLFDFTLSLQWKATPEEMEGVRKMVAGAAPMFYDATEGQMAYRCVDIYNDQKDPDPAQFVVFYENERVGTGVSGWASLAPRTRLNLAMLRDSMGNVKASQVFFHEMSHLFLGLGDEYAPKKECHCAMGMGPFRGYYEYCTDATHEFAQPLSCWESIKRYYPEVEKIATARPGPADAPEPEFHLHDVK